MVWFPFLFLVKMYWWVWNILPEILQKVVSMKDYLLVNVNADRYHLLLQKHTNNKILFYQLTSLPYSIFTQFELAKNQNKLFRFYMPDNIVLTKLFYFIKSKRYVKSACDQFLEIDRWVFLAYIFYMLIKLVVSLI